MRSLATKRDGTERCKEHYELEGASRTGYWGRACLHSGFISSAAATGFVQPNRIQVLPANARQYPNELLCLAAPRQLVSVTGGDDPARLHSGLAQLPS